MVRGRDACWEHCVLVDANRQKVRCNYCHREFSGGVYRMKFHLAQVKNKDIIPCTEVPIDVRDRILIVLTAPKKQKAKKKSKVDQPAFENGQQNSSSASGSLPFPLPSPSEHEDVSKQNSKQVEADKKIATFFFHNCIPFSAAKSVYYQEMVDSIADSGVGYKAPSYEKLRSSLMEKVKGDMYDLYKKYRDEWRETGCTVLCDSWSKSNDATTSLVVFSVTCLKGTLFLKSVDVSDNKDDASYLFELIESVVLEIGVENVVQVITDNTVNYSYAGRLLMAKYESLFWSPCASFCIDEILEDFGKLDWVDTVLEEAKTITSFLNSHSWTGRELIRHKINRYATNFLSLRSVVIQEDNLKHMFSGSEWLTSEAQAVKSLIYLESFWKYAREAVNVSEPLIKILRIVDGDFPAMGYFYEALERAKNSIKGYYKGVEEKYVPIWEMIERSQVHSSLHAAAGFLNPTVCYNPRCKTDLRVRNGFQEAMLRVAIEDNDKMEITRELPVYLNAQGALGTDFAVMGRTLNSPGDWWTAYGYEIPTLQRVAVRILSQPCSSNCRLWNWTNFDTLHCRVDSHQLNDFAFVHCNLWLQSTLHSRRGISKTVDFDQIDVAAHWPAESDPPEPLLHDSWLDYLTLQK